MRTARHIILAIFVTVIVACSGSGGAPCDAEFGGYPYGEMPDLDMQVGDTVETEVWRHFSAEWCPSGTIGGFTASSANPAVVAVSATDLLLTIVALDVADSVRVAVWPTYDGYTDWSTEDKRYSHEFHVRVRPTTPPTH